MRMAKLKSKRDVVMTLQHNNRERMPQNADPQRSEKNLCHGGTTTECLVRFDGLMPKKVRENAVQAIELVMTASPDFSGNWGEYLRDCLDWGLKTFGIDPTKKDIRPAIQYAVHHDEQTPHIHLIVMPLKDGKLNASHFIGGSRDRMAELQDDFYKKVGRKHELERGQPKAETRARHSHHSLAGKADELDKRESVLAGREAKLNEREKKIQDFAAEFKSLIGTTPADVCKLKTQVANWDKTSPAGLRVIAKDIEQSGAATVGEYHQRREAQCQREQQQSRSSSLSR